MYLTKRNVILLKQELGWLRGKGLVDVTAATVKLHRNVEA